MTPELYYGLVTNIPVIQSLRVLEIAAGIALLQAPDKISELLEPLGIKIPSVREVHGLRQTLG